MMDGPIPHRHLEPVLPGGCCQLQDIVRRAEQTPLASDFVLAAEAETVGILGPV